jgi:hypothetical protein
MLKLLLAGLFAIVSLLPQAVRSAGVKADWQSEWEKTVQGAKREGKLSLYLYQGEGELSAVAQLFQKKYPEISVTAVMVLPLPPFELASRLLKTSRIPSTGPEPVLSLTNERAERSSKRPTEALEAFLPFFRNR